MEAHGNNNEVLTQQQPQQPIDYSQILFDLTTINARNCSLTDGTPCFISHGSNAPNLLVTQQETPPVLLNEINSPEPIAVTVVDPVAGVEDFEIPAAVLIGIIGCSSVLVMLIISLILHHIRVHISLLKDLERSGYQPDDEWKKSPLHQMSLWVRRRNEMQGSASKRPSLENNPKGRYAEPPDEEQDDDEKSFQLNMPPKKPNTHRPAKLHLENESSSVRQPLLTHGQLRTTPSAQNKFFPTAPMSPILSPSRSAGSILVGAVGDLVLRTLHPSLILTSIAEEHEHHHQTAATNQHDINLELLMPEIDQSAAMLIDRRRTSATSTGSFVYDSDLLRRVLTLDLIELHQQLKDNDEFYSQIAPEEILLSPVDDEVELVISDDDDDGDDEGQGDEEDDGEDSIEQDVNGGDENSLATVYDLPSDSFQTSITPRSSRSGIGRPQQADGSNIPYFEEDVPEPEPAALPANIRSRSASNVSRMSQLFKQQDEASTLTLPDLPPPPEPPAPPPSPTQQRELSASLPAPLQRPMTRPVSAHHPPPSHHQHHPNQHHHHHHRTVSTSSTGAQRPRSGLVSNVAANHILTHYAKRLGDAYCTDFF